MNLRAASLQLFNKFGQVSIQMIDGLKFRLGCRLPGGLPILKLRFGSVAYDFIFAQPGLNEPTMAQIKTAFMSGPSPHLCRCGSYSAILDAVQRASTLMARGR